MTSSNAGYLEVETQPRCLHGMTLSCGWRLSCANKRRAVITQVSGVREELRQTALTHRRGREGGVNFLLLLLNATPESHCGWLLFWWVGAIMAIVVVNCCQNSTTFPHNMTTLYTFLIDLPSKSSFEASCEFCEKGGLWGWIEHSFSHCMLRVFQNVSFYALKSAHGHPEIEMEQLWPWGNGLKWVDIDGVRWRRLNDRGKMVFDGQPVREWFQLSSLSTWE